MNPHKTGLDDIKKKRIVKNKEIAIDEGKLKLCLLNQCQTTGIKAFAPFGHSYEHFSRSDSLQFGQHY
jgi:hypothetical protein